MENIAFLLPQNLVNQEMPSRKPEAGDKAACNFQRLLKKSLKELSPPGTAGEMTEEEEMGTKDKQQYQRSEFYPPLYFSSTVNSTSFSNLIVDNTESANEHYSDSGKAVDKLALTVTAQIAQNQAATLEFPAVQEQEQLSAVSELVGQSPALKLSVNSSTAKNDVDHPGPFKIQSDLTVSVQTEETSGLKQVEAITAESEHNTQGQTAESLIPPKPSHMRSEKIPAQIKTVESAVANTQTTKFEPGSDVPALGETAANITELAEPTRNTDIVNPVSTLDSGAKPASHALFQTTEAEKRIRDANRSGGTQKQLSDFQLTAVETTILPPQSVTKTTAPYQNFTSKMKGDSADYAEIAASAELPDSLDQDNHVKIELPSEPLTVHQDLRTSYSKHDKIDLDFNESTPVMRTQQDIYNQIVERARIYVRPGENSQMVLQLRPEHLGELTLKVTVDNGMISAAFHSDNYEVRQAIEATLPQLKQELSQQGIKFDNVGVYHGSNQFFDNGQRSPQHQPPIPTRKSPRAFMQAVESVEEITSQATEGVDYRI